MARQYEMSFYRNGTDNQKTPDAKIVLKRPDVENMKEWNKEQKNSFRDFLLGVRQSVELFLEELHSMI